MDWIHQQLARCHAEKNLASSQDKKFWQWAIESYLHQKKCDKRHSMTQKGSTLPDCREFCNDMEIASE